MSELINKVKTKYEIKGEVQVAKVYPELENLTVTPAKTIQSFNHPDSYGYDNVVVKEIDCETLNVIPKKEGQAFDGMYDKVNVKAIDCETLNITPKQENQSFDGMYDKVNVNAIVGDTLNIKPIATAQTFNGLYETVNVEKVQGSILNVTPKEAEQSFNGLYETVNVGTINTEEVTIDPDFSTQDTVEVTATNGKYIKKVTVNKDENLVPENILEGRVVCGIEGTGRNGIDTSDATATAEDIAKDKTAYVNGEKVIGTMEAGDYNAVVNTTIKPYTSSAKRSALSRIITKLPNDITISGDSAEFMFAYAEKLTTIPQLDTSRVTQMSGMFYYCLKLVTIPQLDTSGVIQMKNMFYNCPKLTTIPQLNTSKVSQMENMFYYCLELTTIPQLNTSNVANMSTMFYNCPKLTTIPQLNTSNVTNMYNMFYNCSNLSDESLNNILAMCINAVKMSTKKLSSMGISSAQATRCQSLSNWQAFLDAGWVTGY